MTVGQELAGHRQIKIQVDKDQNRIYLDQLRDVTGILIFAGFGHLYESHPCFIVSLLYV